MRVLTAIPVYNEAAHIAGVLDLVRGFAESVLVVDDGSTDATPDLLRNYPEVASIRHEHNRGYGAALVSAFRYAIAEKYDVLVTLDCDGQHEPSRIPELAACLCEHQADMVSGSRYLKVFDDRQKPPEERRRINRDVTGWINDRLGSRLGLELTDAFCGFKAYNVRVLADLEITDFGYAMPLQVWVQAARLGWRIVETPVPLIYLDESRAFGGALDNSVYRRQHYRAVFEAELARQGFTP